MRELLVYADNHVYPGTPIWIWELSPDLEIWAELQYVKPLYDTYGEPVEGQAREVHPPIRITIHGDGSLILPHLSITVAGAFHHDRCSCITQHRVYRVTAEL